jgi:hypothetical protein
MTRTRHERLPKTPAYPNGQEVESKFTKRPLATRRLERRRRNRAARAARRASR